MTTPDATPSTPENTPVTPTEPLAATAPRPEPSNDDISALLTELGLTPGQVKGRLEASKEWEKRSKANADKARQFDEAQEAAKTELEKANDRAEAAEKALTAANVTALRASIAADKGVPVSLLSGSTQDEIEAAADALLAFKGTTPKAPSADGQGQVGTPITDGPAQLSRADLAGMSGDEINAAKAEGRLDVALGIKTKTT